MTSSPQAGGLAARLCRPLPRPLPRSARRTKRPTPAARRARAAAAVAGLIAATLPTATATATAATTATVTTAGAQVPRLDWQPCAEGFECATARVPLDYRAPRGATIDIAVIKHPATDPTHRIGSLFYNPGGPGVPGTQALPAMTSLFPEQLRARFDIVSFDPRGIGASTTTRCFPDNAAEQRFFAGVPEGFPVGRPQERAWTDAYARFGQECLHSAPALLPHLSTANVARDMDLLRQAVGDRQLTYYGVSYGTYLGATYANLFPGRVRSMVLDSAVDPVAWSTGRGGQADQLGSFLRTGTDLAADRTLNAFLDQCGQAGPRACAFAAPGATATRAKFATLLQRLRQRPVTLDTPMGAMPFSYASTVESTLMQLYAAAPVANLAAGWPGLGQQLQQLWTASTAPATPAATAPAAPTAAPATGGYQGKEQSLGVMCADSADPRSTSGYPAQAALARARSGDLGSYFAWAAEPCATWPARDRDRYDGPWNRPTANPVLVLANTGDPAWPYQGSQAMSRTLARARLLTVDGYGHTVMANPSACAAAHEVRYLVDGVLPPSGTVCEPDHRPFEGAAH
ncbi:alpha/beta hydrolase [Kitasatospora sp. HPMI-4]|uniref:alpha/beta hydrolase n=1 Tax=Kitasatospora sp. HPMI-4 TaxID=3448443 RepID=UPI003F1C61B6